MTGKERLEDYLRQNRVAYAVQHHPLAYTAQEVAESEHIPGQQLAKVVMAFRDGKLVMLVLAASTTIDLAQAEKVLDAQAFDLAHEAEFARVFPDCEVGTMPPFGNLYDIPVYVEQSLAENETIYFQAGNSTDTMSVRYADFARLVQPRVVTFRKRVAAEAL
jgi:Ala-tRNA(Pro) deacylase